jgi:hypothetical protein
VKFHFLHVWKTGGTAIKHALQPFADKFDIVLHSHMVSLSDIPTREGVIFSVRDPVIRYVSAFNSRKRCGRPTYDVPWNALEQRTFSRFHSADSLACGLSASDPEEREAAVAALRQNLAFLGLSRWFINADFLLSRISDIRLIIDQAHLAVDFEVLKRVLGLPAECRLPSDPVASHRAPGDQDATLSDLGQANIRNWYAADLALYALCRELREFTN